MDRRTVDRRMGPVNWIGAYLEWTSADVRALGLGPLVRSGIWENHADASGEFAAAYLDWMGGRRGGSDYDAAASVSDPGVDPARGLDVFREALMVALRTESDCIRFLRRILEAGDTSTHTVKLASEALEHAERLLEDERRAWRALPGLNRGDLPQSSTARRADFENNWPRALEEVAADVQALAGTVLALQAH
jgi:hypothetical protein